MTFSNVTCVGGGVASNTTKGVLFTNDRFGQILGLTGQEAAGDGWVRSLHSDDRAAFLASAKGILEYFDPSRPDPGRVTMRRLNRVEYNNPVRDLTGPDFDPHRPFVDDITFDADDGAVENALNVYLMSGADVFDGTNSGDASYLTGYIDLGIDVDPDNVIYRSALAAVTQIVHIYPNDTVTAV